MGNMVNETLSLFRDMGLEINREMSATNDYQCENTVTIVDGTRVYKYLSIIEDHSSNIMRESFEKVRRELLARMNRLCESNLNSKNLFKAINEHAISLVNYHIGLQHLETADFLKLDHEIRQTLIKHKVHLKPGCKERLYLPRTEMGKGLHSVEMKSEYILLQLLDTMKKYENILSRRAAILKVEEQNKTLLSLIY
ncbi:hypothetical protein TCON_1556 [Astathelohania contejeani]|uniref:Uncharacterized protein n=1 Tax=Astathelohania contejeani TaxID=164912 RepID=A0ABQ7HYL2_9MICR|nr:hypothetical protein TCON_1556 [Thelohania contejeani]